MCCCVLVEECVEGECLFEVLLQVLVVDGDLLLFDECVVIDVEIVVLCIIMQGEDYCVIKDVVDVLLYGIDEFVVCCMDCGICKVFVGKCIEELG